MRYGDIRPVARSGRRDHIDLTVLVGSEQDAINGVNRHTRRRLRWARLTGWLGQWWWAVPW